MKHASGVSPLNNELAIGKPLFATMQSIEKGLMNENLNNLMQSKAQDRSKKIARKSNNFTNHCFMHLCLLGTLFGAHDSINIVNVNNFKNEENNERDLKIPHRLKMMRNVIMGVI